MSKNGYLSFTGKTKLVSKNGCLFLPRKLTYCQKTDMRVLIEKQRLSVIDGFFSKKPTREGGLPVRIHTDIHFLTVSQFSPTKKIRFLTLT